MKGLSRKYYLEPNKVIRDLVHGYINLTKFELALIDTEEFQRLKDIRQLSCQHVYPEARHTRFEHSLGVMELTKQAVKALNNNGRINVDTKQDAIIDDDLLFNVTIVALLHDVGHCPFSHMGEKEFDPEIVRKDLCNTVKEHWQLKDCPGLINKLSKPHANNIGSVHEQLSCIVIIEKYAALLDNLNEKAKNEKDSCELNIDYEFIIRCILGIKYDVNTDKNKLKNTVLQLINSKIFDMDKLDYIMRDSFFTGIGAPLIDTHRLFKNMYLGSNDELVFTSRAVSVLQNMIDSRDMLYMYVYNHHAVILSDFMNTYISRRLTNNAHAFLSMIYPEKNAEEITDESFNFRISGLGLIPKSYLFSVEAVVELKRSDSDWISLINVINSNYSTGVEYIKQNLKGLISTTLNDQKKADEIISQSEAEIDDLANKIITVYKLIKNYQSRVFLKPWWKTAYEFNAFMRRSFPNGETPKQIYDFICSDSADGRFKSSEARSQIVKHVVYITQKLYERNKESTKLITPLRSGDLLIVERSNRFLNKEAIEKLKIAFKVSEIVGAPQGNSGGKKYYDELLTNIIPQKDYNSIYPEHGFYIFSAKLDEKAGTLKERREHYKFIEQILVFVINEFIGMDKKSFMDTFGENLSIKDRRKGERQSMEEMLIKFIDNEM